MKRFILLTFGFLGWAFYEMSGGADFQPARAQMAEVQPSQPQAVSTPQTPDDTMPAVQLANATPVDTTPPGFDSAAQSQETSPVSLNLTSAEDTSEAAVQPEPAGQDEPARVDAVTLVPVNAGNTTTSGDTPAIIPSLITPDDQGLNTVSAATQGDVRTVAGNRVNVRGGPGTDYDVVIRLGRGDAVEVLQDNGDGWVQMRPVDGGPTGWMADFLLADS